MRGTLSGSNHKSSRTSDASLRAIARGSGRHGSAAGAEAASDTGAAVFANDGAVPPAAHGLCAPAGLDTGCGTMGTAELSTLLTGALAGVAMLGGIAIPPIAIPGIAMFGGVTMLAGMAMLGGLGGFGGVASDPGAAHGDEMPGGGAAGAAACWNGSPVSGRPPAANTIVCGAGGRAAGGGARCAAGANGRDAAVGARIAAEVGLSIDAGP